MRKIYQSFEELLKQNQGLFSLLRKKEGKKINGTFRAIWDARQAEIEEYKAALDELYKQINFEQKQSREYKTLLEKSVVESAVQDTQIETLTEELVQKEKIVTYLNKKFKERLTAEEQLEAEIDKNSRYQRSLESAFNMAKSQIDRESETIKSTEKIVEEKSGKISNQLTEINKLKNTNQEINQELDNTLKELEDSKSYARQYKMFNNKMANELHRMNNKLHELDPLQ